MFSTYSPTPLHNVFIVPTQPPHLYFPWYLFHIWYFLSGRVELNFYHSHSKYASLVLVGSSLSSRGVHQLVARLHHLAVGVYGGRSGGLLVASSKVADEDLSDVRRSVLRYLNCPFSRWVKFFPLSPPPFLIYYLPIVSLITFSFIFAHVEHFLLHILWSLPI